jgi:thiamine pyrophosphokinase
LSAFANNTANNEHKMGLIEADFARLRWECGILGNFSMKTENSGMATLLGGAAVAPPVMYRALKLAPKLYCADAGANTAVAMGIEPVAVVGDMDSITAATRAQLSCPVLLDTDQNTTDFEKILAYAAENVVICLGFLGQRLDHSLAAMNALSKFPSKRAILVGEEDICFLSPPDMQISARKGDRVSLFPMRESRGKSRGLHWPLDPHVFHPHAQTATSNRATGDEVHLYEVSGAMLVILPLSYLESVAESFLSMPED